MNDRRTIVVSAVNLRKGGTLTILRNCLRYLSARTDEFRVVALVHRRALCDMPGIEYRELPWCTKSWFHRLWAEYVTMHRISRQLAAQDGRKVWTWLSLHDTTPRVEAEHREVYCHTSFPFLKLQARDFLMDPKIPLFALFTRFAYQVNIHRNESIIVQQEWFADALSRLLRVPRERFRVIPPERPCFVPGQAEPARPYTFFYASTPDCHKNFETLCRAAEGLERQVGEGRFRVVLTLRGDENRYARWLYRKWGHVKSISFAGFMSKETLFAQYASSQCFVFPSRIETWGLPVSEYMGTHPDGTLLLADLPYAHETAAGAAKIEFFPATDYVSLQNLMYENLAIR